MVGLWGGNYLISTRVRCCKNSFFMGYIAKRMKGNYLVLSITIIEKGVIFSGIRMWAAHRGRDIHNSRHAFYS